MGVTSGRVNDMMWRWMHCLHNNRFHRFLILESVVVPILQQHLGLLFIITVKGSLNYATTRTNNLQRTTSKWIFNFVIFSAVHFSRFRSPNNILFYENNNFSVSQWCKAHARILYFFMLCYCWDLIGWQGSSFISMCSYEVR